MDNNVYIIIGTAYLECDEDTIQSVFLKNSISVSNTVFERKLFNGFKENTKDVFFLSCPTIGYYPTSLKKPKIRGLTSKDGFFVLPYNSSIGFSGISKKHAFIKQLKTIISKTSKDSVFHLIICEAHKPYLDVAEYAKKRKMVKDVTILIPDLPEHNIRSKNALYKLLKRNNVAQIYKKIDKYVDKFVLFAKPMVNKFNIEKKNYIVSEGLSSGTNMPEIKKDYNDSKKHIVFIGKFDERNGVGLIYDVAKKINDDTIVFDLYGVAGTDFDAFASKDINNVINHGFLKPSEVGHVLSNATILLSPRFSNQEYTKYSFPSKMFDYLESFKPIITFKLESYPSEMDELVYYPNSETADSLLETIKKVLADDTFASKRVTKYSLFLNKYNEKKVASSIIDLING